MFQVMFAGMIVAAAMKEQLPIQRSSPDKNPLEFEIDGSTALDTITFASPLPRHRLRSTNVTLEKESRAPGDNDVRPARGTARQNATITLTYLWSYQGMGVAAVSCGGGCGCGVCIAGFFLSPTRSVS